MRLRELINPKISQTRYRGTFGARPKTDIGGKYSAVRPLRSNPNQVEKYLLLPTNVDQDAYYQYFLAIRDRMEENPCFPHIHRVKMTTDQDGDVRISYVIERLSSYQSASPEEVLTLYNRILGRNVQLQSGAKGELSKELWWEDLVENIIDVTDSGNYRRIKDPMLVDALKLVVALKEKHNFAYDFHLNNFMIRRGAEPQLVLSDPLHDMDKSMVPIRPSDQTINMDPEAAAEYAVNRGKRWPRAEPIILQKADIALAYAIELGLPKWPELEAVLLKEGDSRYLAFYAIKILGRRWPAAENMIAQDSAMWEKYREVFRMM